MHTLFSSYLPEYSLRIRLLWYLTCWFCNLFWMWIHLSNLTDQFLYKATYNVCIYMLKHINYTPIIINKFFNIESLIMLIWSYMHIYVITLYISANLCPYTLSREQYWFRNHVFSKLKKTELNEFLSWSLK